ncbi:hypothetical protein [Nocardiopsis algeriensis]|uniref:Uncharacterized protein n=1 Tax=Nocardiopsis algeriensis TaxID=1478215 RepID=A0A841ILT7_9ACTN|nr:hypothetical protein [Nocardiopsis algeriensis]MBB6118984.1 hypothetical protein [Nocardiopsis algeriensis]
MWRWNPAAPRPLRGHEIEAHLAPASLGTDPLLRAGAEAVLDGDTRAGLTLLADSRDDPERRVLEAEVLGRAAIDRFEELTEHLDGGADRADLLLWMGNTLLARARRSGGGTADRKAAVAVLGDAVQLLLTAAGLRPDDAAPWVALQTAAMGAGAEREEKDRLWQEADRRAPHLFAAHMTRVRSLSPLRGGSEEEMFAFAGAAADGAPEGDPLPALLALAHAEFLRAERRRLSGEVFLGFIAEQAAGRLRGEALQELFESARGWAASARPHPCDVQAHHLFAWAFHRTGAAEAARWHLEAAGNVYCEMPWSFFGDPRAAVAAAMAELGVHPGRPAPEVE